MLQSKTSLHKCRRHFKKQIFMFFIPSRIYCSSRKRDIKGMSRKVGGSIGITSHIVIATAFWFYCIYLEKNMVSKAQKCWKYVGRLLRTKNRGGIQKVRPECRVALIFSIFVKLLNIPKLPLTLKIHLVWSDIIHDCYFYCIFLATSSPRPFRTVKTKHIISSIDQGTKTSMRFRYACSYRNCPYFYAELTTELRG